MSEMDQIMAMIRGQQGGMGGNNLGSMPSMGPRPAPAFGGGLQTGNPYPMQVGGGGWDAINQPGQSQIGSNGDWSGGGGLGGSQGGMGGQMGMLQALLGMLGRGQGMGQSGGMGLQNGIGRGFGNGGGNSGVMSSMPGRVYAGGNPNFNENGGYMAAGTKPMMPPTIPGGYPGPTPQFQPKPYLPPTMPGGTPGPTGNGVSLARLGMRTAY